LTLTLTSRFGPLSNVAWANMTPCDQFLDWTLPVLSGVNVLEHWRGNQKLTIQRNWYHKTKKNKTQRNLYRTPLYANKHK
jgi:hypothetical protein